MSEYISRDDLIKALEADYNRSWCSKPQGVEEYVDGARDEYDDVLKIVCGMKAADVQPVKHGRWETWGYVFHGIEWKRCSVCGKTADVSYIALLEGRIEPVTLSLCGCCGARMDGDTK